MEQIAIGDVLDGKYVIEGMLGEGAMGLVFAARHRSLNKQVAIKTLRAEIAADKGLVGRFEQEARAASAIGHPNIIEVFDLGSMENGARYMVMEYLHGESLADLITARPYQTGERTIELMSQVLSALGAAHKQGIVHRDLKPENIFVARVDDRPDTVKLLDFGISKVLSEIADPRIAGTNHDARATRLGMVMGTPLYMAPEQARGMLDLDHRVDLWAVGVVMYEMMCGRPPFDGENYNQILGEILQGKLEPPRSYCPQISPALEAIIVKALAYDRADRFQSAADMRDALAHALTHPMAPKAAAGSSTAPLGPQRKAPSDAAMRGPAPAATAVVAPAAAGASLELGEVSTDALAGAGRVSAEDDAAMLSALDRLASGNVDLALGTAPAPAARATPAAPPKAPAAAPQAAAAAVNPFAPPDSASEELVLDLATEPAVRAHVPARASQTAAAPDAAAAPARRATGSTTVASGPGLPLGKIVIGLVVLVVVGGGGFAGYRYATKGYLFEPPAIPRVAVQLSTIPAEAELRVDGVVVASRTLELERGASVRVRAVAPGRLSREVGVVVEGPTVAPVALPLPNRLSPSSRYVSADRDDRHGPAAAAGDSVLDLALSKLDDYADCLMPVTDAVSAAREEYRRATRGSASNIRRNNVPTLRPVPLDAVTTCRSNLASAPTAQPSFPAVDEPAAAVIGLIDELDTVLEEVGGYYTEGRYFNDDLAYGRKMHRKVQQALDGSWKTLEPIAAAVGERRAYWQRVELEQVARTEGEGAHWQLRRLALAIQLWEGALARERDVKARQDALRVDYDQLVAYATANPAEMQEIGGVEDYLASVKVLLDRIDEGPVGIDEAIERGNTCIAMFNTLVL